jgi:hypothetical protein
MIYKKLTKNEKALLEILEHPVWNAEFLRKEVDETWEHTDYQKEVLADCGNYISFRAARSVGKSETLLDKLTYFAINNFFSTPTIALVTPNRVHLNPLWRKMSRWLSLHPFLKHFRDKSNSQIHDLSLKNGVTIDCRIAGIQSTGASVIGLHTPILVVDEGGFFPWAVWLELMPTLNTWETGFQVYVCGTPSGERENNVLYFADQLSQQYSKHRVSAFDNPRYSDDAQQRDKDQYGGEDSDDYRRLVLGEHASPVVRLFSRDTIPTSNFAPFLATLSNRDLELDPAKLQRLLSSLPRKSGPVAAGIDLGYTDPTVISLFEKTRGTWKNFARITLEHIEYPKQLVFLDELDNIYDFYFLAIDEGHAGIAVTQELTSVKFNHKDFAKKLVSVSFGAPLEIGLDLDGNPIKSRVKNIAVEKLRYLMDNQQILLSSKDDKILSELERVESTKTSAGNTVYRVRSHTGSLRGEDHIFASLLCFSYAMYLEDDYNSTHEEKVKLFGARWAR